MARRLVADLESNGLYHEVTRIHLFLMKDLDTKEVFIFREHQAKQALKMLREAELVIWHNGINYDLPVLEKLFPGFETDGITRDTLIISRLMFSNIKEDTDFDLFRKGMLPGAMIGRHSLEAWGYRLGVHKGTYGKQDTDTGVDIWAEWSQEMEDYGVQDLEVTEALWNFLLKEIAAQNYPMEAIRFEHRFADLMSRVERNGFCFNETDAWALYEKLGALRDDLTVKMKAQFRPWYVPEKWKKGVKKWSSDAAENTTPGKTLCYKAPMKADRTAGAPFTPIILKEFNPGSRDMIADRLQVLFGWVPKEFTETGKPKVSEDILRDLVGELDEDEDGVEESEEELYAKLLAKIPQCKDLADYLLIVKRLGQLHDGKNGWLRLVRDGTIHGSVNTVGAISRRVTHARPNVSQTPAVRSPYGKEMRALWCAPNNWWVCGTDLSGVEIRCFANVLAEFDGGTYGRWVIEDDIHAVNQRAFGVPTRDQSKTTLYALLLIKSLRGAIHVE